MLSLVQRFWRCLLPPPPNNLAQALTNPTSAYIAGGDEELWNSSTSSFNYTVLNDIKEKIFGTTNPVSYIKTNGAYDWEAFGKNSPSSEAGIQYYVVPARSVTANGKTYVGINDKVGNANGMVVKLNGNYWMVTSLTLDTRGNVVATLYLAGTLGTSKYYSSGASTRGNNAYARSVIRNTLISSTDTTAVSNWGLFRENSAFAQNYLVQPKYIQYQHTERFPGRGSSWSAYNLQNDAVYDLNSGWKSSSYRFLASETFADPNGTQVRCDAWGDDYIWLPSVTEAGFNDQLPDNNIWRLPNVQRIPSTTVSLTAYRTGDWDTYRNTLSLTATGLFSALDNPENVTTTYNYGAQTVKSVYDAKPSDVTWYNPTIYEPADTKVKLSYFDNNGAAVTTIKDAGTYWVKADITAYVNAVYAEVDADGVKNGWDATQIALVKSYKKPVFDGIPDTSDSAHIESDTVRWFRFIISPKELTVNKPTYNASTGVFTAPSFAVQSELYADAPTLATRFTGTAVDGTSVDQINTLPNKRGTFTAQAFLVKSATDTTAYDGGNYVIKDASNMTCDVEIGYQKLTILKCIQEVT